MDIICSLLLISIVAGLITSIVAFFIHRTNWYQKIKKSPIYFLKLFVTNTYQFNDKLFGAVSLSVSIATSIILGNSFYIIFFCDSLSFEYCDIAKIFLAVVVFRVVLLFLLYSFFYDKNVIED